MSEQQNSKAEEQKSITPAPANAAPKTEEQKALVLSVEVAPELQATADAANNAAIKAAFDLATKQADLKDKDGKVIGQVVTSQVIKPMKASVLMALNPKATRKEVEAIKLAGSDALKEVMVNDMRTMADDPAWTGKSVRVTRNVKTGELSKSFTFKTCEREMESIKAVADAFRISIADAKAYIEAGVKKAESRKGNGKGKEEQKSE